MGNGEWGMVVQIPTGFVLIKPNNYRKYDDS